jgi:hypothetical protein
MKHPGNDPGQWLLQLLADGQPHAVPDIRFRAKFAGWRWRHVQQRRRELRDRIVAEEVCYPNGTRSFRWRMLRPGETPVDNTPRFTAVPRWMITQPPPNQLPALDSIAPDMLWHPRAASATRAASASGSKLPRVRTRGPGRDGKPQ